MIRSGNTLSEPKADFYAMLCLRLGAFCCFAGWAWVHYYWEGPYGGLLWANSTYELAESFGVTWDDFVGTGADDGLIQKWLGRLYLPYCMLSVLALTASKESRLQKAGLIFGSGLLSLMAYSKYLNDQQQLPTLIEQGGQVLIPTVLVLALSVGARHRLTLIVACVAFLATFAGHGSYAVGLWPTPPTFFAMTSVILGVDYETAKLLLLIAGILDYVVCVAIAIPLLRNAALFYAALWGFVTALARPVAGMSTSLIFWGADQYIHETVVRTPHFMLPLFLYFAWAPRQLKDTT
ncbi:MAG: hypothetical protein AAF802_18115 [Planctomycetota bacterium]